MKTLFSYLILAATLIPFIVFGLIYAGFEISFVTVISGYIALAGATHVPTTLYLLTDPGIREKCKDKPVQTIIIPIFLFLISMIIFIASPIEFVLIYVIFYIHYQAWHFGSQNLGIYTLSSISSVKRPMHNSERLAIKLAVLAGVLGTFIALEPNMMLDSTLFPFRLDSYKPFFNASYNFGLLLITLNGLFSLYLVYKHKIYKNLVTLSIFLASIFFFLPIYLGNDIIFTFLTYATAHGLQYLCVLFLHSFKDKSYSQSKNDETPIKKLYFSIFTFIVIFVASYALWKNLGSLGKVSSNITSLFFQYVLSDSQKTKVVLGILFGASIAHFWFDQNIWKFREPDRRAWLHSRFAFLFK